MISRFTTSLMPVPSCSAHVINNNHNNNPPQLTTQTSITLPLPFKPSAIARPPSSDNSLLSLCITRRHTSRQPLTRHSHPHFKHAYTTSRPPPPPSHAPAYQVDLLQALESAEACAQRLNVVILQLLQRVA